MKKKTIIFEINECDFNFFFYGSKKYNYPGIKKFFRNKKKFKTITNDKKEGLDLDPWVQWVSMHTGTVSKKHKVFRTGQSLKKEVSQIWETLANRGIKSSLWGLFNAVLRNKKNIDLFYPDPWNFTQKAHPKKFNSYLKLPRYYALNYPNIRIIKIIFFGLMFFKKILLIKDIKYFLKKILNFTYIFLFSRFASFNLYFILDIVSLLIVKDHLSKKKSDLTIIALNSLAHFQHNFWDKKKYEKFYFWYLNEIINLLSIISKNFEKQICLNGFSQKKIKNIYYLRIKDNNKFLKILDIKCKKYRSNMTTGATIFFKDMSEKRQAILKLNNVSIFNKKVFEVYDFQNENKIFYKFNIFFTKPLKIISSKKDGNFIKQSNILKLKKNNNDKSIFDMIMNNINLLKSTSSHLPSGILYSTSNVNIKKKYFFKNKIKNEKLFDIILDNFENN